MTISCICQFIVLKLPGGSIKHLHSSSSNIPSKQIYNFNWYRWRDLTEVRGLDKDSVVGVKLFNLAHEACHHFLYPSLEFFLPPPLEKYHDVYQIIGFNWVWFVFSTHFWDLQTQSNKGLITYLSAFTLFYIFHYSHSFYINYTDL